MATFSPADRTALESAINFLTGAQAYELPFADDLALRLAKVSDSTGFLGECRFLEAVKLNPLSTLLKWLDSVTGSGGGSSPCPPCVSLSGDISPASAVTPDFVGQLYVQNPGPLAVYWRSTGLTSADWTAIVGGTSTATSILATDGLLGLSLRSDSVSTTFSMPNLTGLGGSSGLYLSSFTALVSFSAAALVTVAGAFEIDDDSGANLLLTIISAPLLVTITGNTFCGNNPSLTTVDLSSWVPTDGTSISFSGDALTAASVELILHQCVLAGVTTCTIILDGGTNTGLAALSVQGQSDYAALVVAGNTMTINP